MLQVGKMNDLKVKEIEENHYILCDDEDETVWIGKHEFPERTLDVGDEVCVFIYRDARRYLVCTTMKPIIMPGEFGYLYVDEVSEHGALLDWGLMRPLFMPSRNFKTKIVKDRQYLVYVYYDFVSQQIIATTRIQEYVNLSPAKYEFNQSVKILIVQEHERGHRAIVENAHWGMIYADQTFERLEIGDKITAYVKAVREDGKIDLSLRPLGYKVVDDLGDQILAKLKSDGGSITVSDRSDAQDIADMFGCSKKAFKKAIGTLFKHRLIEIHDEYICLTHKGASKD